MKTNSDIVQAEICPGAPLLIIGQAPGGREIEEGRPFIGPSGNELWRWAKRAGFERAVAAHFFFKREEIQALAREWAAEARAMALYEAYLSRRA